jgi:hypothetical protein
MGRDVYQPRHGWIVAGFGYDRSTIAVSRNKNAHSVLLSENAPGCCHIVFERCLRLLHDADVVSVPDQNVVGAFPPRAVGPGAVNEHYVFHWTGLCLDGGHVQRSKQYEMRTTDFANAANIANPPLRSFRPPPLYLEELKVFKISAGLAPITGNGICAFTADCGPRAP